MKRCIALLLTLLLVCALLAGCAAGGDTADVPDLVGNCLIEDFSAKTLYGDTVDMAGLFSGYDVIMLNIWGTSCGPCVQEMPQLGMLAEEYAAKNVLVVGVVTDISDADGNLLSDLYLDEALNIVESAGADYTHLLPCEGLMPLLAQISALPTTVFLNAEGFQLGSAQIGALDKDGWAALLDELLLQLEAA